MQNFNDQNSRVARCTRFGFGKTSWSLAASERRPKKSQHSEREVRYKIKRLEERDSLSPLVKRFHSVTGYVVFLCLNQSARDSLPFKSALVDMFIQHHHGTCMENLHSFNNIGARVHIGVGIKPHHSMSWSYRGTKQPIELNGRQRHNITNFVSL